MPRKLRKSFVGHPSANLFLTISRAGVFQQPRLIDFEAGNLKTTNEERGVVSWLTSANKRSTVWRNFTGREVRLWHHLQPQYGPGSVYSLYTLCRTRRQFRPDSRPGVSRRDEVGCRVTTPPACMRRSGRPCFRPSTARSFADRRPRAGSREVSKGRVTRGSRIKAGNDVSNLRGVQIFILAVDGRCRSTTPWENLRAFWQGYFKEAGAESMGFAP